MSDLVLMPEPQKIEPVPGAFAVRGDLVLWVPSELERPEQLAVADLQAVFERWIGHRLEAKAIGGAVPDAGVVLRIDGACSFPSNDPSAYRIAITPRRVELVAGKSPGLFYGIQTLRQIGQSCGARWPCLMIIDYPDFAVRGFYHDVTRGRVPTLATLKMLANRLAQWKINQLQLYVEHVFDFEVNPKIGRGCSPLTADEIQELDAYCRDRRIDFVPSLASFGHMGRVLSLPEYRHLAEVEATQSWEETTWSDRSCGLTLDPVNPESRRLVEQMYAEYLPLFSSRLVNVCADETFDLGKGKNRDRAEKEGTGRLYIDHIRWLHELAGRHGKRMMFWGDIVQQHPELLDQVPSDAILLHWGYSADMDYESTGLFQRAGLTTYVCPGCSGWNRFVNGINSAEQNIRRFAAAGVRYGAAGLLNTDWGDCGHVNFLACSWHPILVGAAMSWNQGHPSPEDFDPAFDFLLFGPRDGRAAASLRRAARGGDMGHTWSLFCAAFADRAAHQRWAPEMAQTAIRSGLDAAKLFDAYQQNAHGDPQDCTELALACRFHAMVGQKVQLAHRLLDLGSNKDPALAGRLEAFASELEARAIQFEQVWLVRYKRSNLDEVLAAMRRVSSEARQIAVSMKQE